MDITLSCEEIVDFTREKSFEEFLADRLLQLALEREFEIIGEAIARLERLDPDRIETKIPEFRKIIGFRNIIAHGYDVIDDASLWDFAKNKVPELLQKAKDF